MWWLEEVVPRSPPSGQGFQCAASPLRRITGSPPCEQGFQYVAFPLSGMSRCPADSSSSEIVREVRDNTDLEYMYGTSWTVVDRPDPRTIPFPPTEWIVQFRNRNSQHSFSYFFYPPTARLESSSIAAEAVGKLQGMLQLFRHLYEICDPVQFKRPHEPKPFAI